ncbi:MAG: HNH endonuclease [Betaproteobacteria bacterium]|nr:HNH endonuclease [Betaproteobacteria bacterium]
MEAHLHRPLEFGEVVHHVNGDSTDDRIENLLLYSSQAQHMRDEFQEGRLVGLRLGPLSLRRP